MTRGALLLVLVAMACGGAPFTLGPAADAGAAGEELGPLPAWNGDASPWDAGAMDPEGGYAYWRVRDANAPEMVMLLAQVADMRDGAHDAAHDVGDAIAVADVDASPPQEAGACDLAACPFRAGCFAACCTPAGKCGCLLTPTGAFCQ